MKKLFYPAVFHKAEEGGFWIQFPDFPECITQGEDFLESYKMAVEVLSIGIASKIKNKEKIPKASAPEEIYISDDGVIVMIENVR